MHFLLFFHHPSILCCIPALICPSLHPLLQIPLTPSIPPCTKPLLHSGEILTNNYRLLYVLHVLVPHLHALDLPLWQKLLRAQHFSLRRKNLRALHLHWVFRDPVGITSCLLGMAFSFFYNNYHSTWRHPTLHQHSSFHRLRQGFHLASRVQISRVRVPSLLHLRSMSCSPLSYLPIFGGINYLGHLYSFTLITQQL